MKRNMSEHQRYQNLCQIAEANREGRQSENANDRETRMADLLARKISPDLRSLVIEANREGAAAESISGKFCSGCSLCCWSMAVEHMPLVSISGNPLGSAALKPAGSDCAFVVNKRCKLHNHGKMPVACQGYACPYTSIESGMPMFSLMGDRISPFPFRVHQPELFRDVLIKLDFRGIVPAIPVFLPVDEAKHLIETTQCCLGQEQYFIFLSTRHQSNLKHENIVQWSKAATPKDYITALNSMNNFQIRMMKKELAKPGFIAAVQSLVERNISPEEAFRTSALDNVLDMRRYEISLSETEQREMQEAA